MHFAVSFCGTSDPQDVEGGMRLANEIVALTALAVFQQFIIACLVALVMLLAVSPEGANRVRGWIAAAKDWMA